MKMDDIKFGKAYINKINGEEYIPMYRSSSLGSNKCNLVTLQRRKTGELLSVMIEEFDNVFKDEELEEYEFKIADTRTRIVKVKAKSVKEGYRILQDKINRGSLKLDEGDSNGIEIL